MKPGALIVAVLPGAVETKVRPAVVIASETYLTELTARITDYLLREWQAAGLRAQSCFRAYIITLQRSNVTVIEHLSSEDWTQVKHRVLRAFAT